MAKQKSGKLKIPKRVAGIKLPKPLRKKANKALMWAENPIVADALAAALLAGAKALSDQPSGKGSPSSRRGKKAE